MDVKAMPSSHAVVETGQSHMYRYVASFLQTFTQTPAYTARPRIWGYCIARCTIGTHCAYPRRDGQAELTKTVHGLQKRIQTTYPANVIAIHVLGFTVELTNRLIVKNGSIKTF